MGIYIGYANGGTYGYKGVSGNTGGEIASNHYFAGVYAKNSSTYYSVISFPAINEINKNIVIQNATVRIRSTAEGPCSTAQVYVTNSDDRYSTEGVLAASNVVIDSSGKNWTTIKLTAEGCNQIAYYHSLGQPFYLRFTSTAPERYRFVGYSNYAYSDLEQYGAPKLEFEYGYGASTGFLSNDSVITLGSTIYLTVNSLSQVYKNRAAWYLNGKLYGQNEIDGSGVLSSYYPSTINVRDYFSSTSTSTQGMVVLETLWNGNVIGSNTYYFTVNLGNNALPTMNPPSFIFKNPNGTNQNFCLQNYSSIYCTAEAFANGGASITNYQVIITGQSSGNFSFSNALKERKLDISLSRNGTVTVTIIATDSRGKTITNSNSFTITAYSPPSITSTNFYRCDHNGNVSAEGNYIQGTANYTYSEVHSNSITLSEKKINGTDNSSISLNTTNKQIFLNTYPVGSSLTTIKITLQDSFGSSVSREISVAGINYLMHFRDGAIGIGSPASNDKALTIGWPVKFANGYLSNAPAQNLILTKATWKNNNKNNETHDIIFERPDDTIYEGRIDMINDSFRFYAYHKDTPTSSPLSVLNLDIPNKRLSVGELTLTTALSASYGGTGYTSLQATRNAMGLGNTTGALPVENGGTGATNAADALVKLGIKKILYGSSTSSVTVENGAILLVPVS